MNVLVTYVFRNIRSNRLVTTVVLLAMFAVGLVFGGVGAVVSGLAHAFSVQGHRTRVVVRSKDVIGESDSVLDLEALAITKASREALRISPEIVSIALLKYPDGTGVDPVFVRGLEADGMQMHDARIIEGRAPTPGANEIVVGETLAQHLPWFKVGATIPILNERFAVVGKFTAPGYMAGEAWTTRTTVLVDPRRTSLSVIYVDTASEADAASLVHDLDATRRVSLEALTEPELFAKLRGDHKNLDETLTMVFLFVMSGAIIVASSLLTLVQRRRIAEYFTLRALGFTSGAIARLIVFETQLLAIGGGLAGLVVAFTLVHSRSISATSTNGFTINFSAQLTPLVILGGLALLTAIGVLGSAAPIVRTLRADIPTGLREA